MDKPRHPHVIRTWTVDRIRSHGRHDQPLKGRASNPPGPPRDANRNRKPSPGSPPPARD